ncbi:PREDICTED: uncharacterized protein LOC108614559 [Drosophila arizonae]|uniref:Uncharacterized protein LOC108614559 n=1 Tax=Drosophila arizonae TaxID=7263 RepID=A0ABM1PAI5_DROAR|nr:PREDICTED: uncharacterized protein LOC108614559 [Drosophila arizonae]
MTDFRPKFGSIRKDRIEDPEDRRYFVYRVFIQFIVYTVLAFIQWLCLLAITRHICEGVILSNESALIVLFFMGLLFFLVFAVSPQLRHRVCANWLVTFVVVEAQVLAIGLLSVRSDYLLMLIGFVFVLVIMIVVLIVVIFLPFDLTNYGTLLFMYSLCVFVFCVYCIMFTVVLLVRWPFYLFIFGQVCLVVPIMAYHEQTILGKGEVRSSLHDDKFCALLLFHDFLALFLPTFFWYYW